MSTAAIIVAFIASTIGFSLFLFGKRQRRIPQYAAGMLLMASPLVVHDPLWGVVTAVGILVAMRVGVLIGV